MSGVSKVDTDSENHTATLIFDSEKTTVEVIKKALAGGGFPVEGEPTFLK
jgi:copper chaperone CopZ